MNTQQRAIETIARLSNVTEETVIVALKSASVDELRKAANLANVFGIFLKYDKTLSEEIQHQLGMTALLTSVLLGSAPDADLTELADEVAAQGQKVTTFDPVHGDSSQANTFEGCKVPEAPPALNVGDRVKLLVDLPSTGRSAGDTGTVSKVHLQGVDGNNYNSATVLFDDGTHNRYYWDRFEIIRKMVMFGGAGEPSHYEIPDQPKAPAEPLKVLPGARVKLLSSIASFRAGETVKVSRLGCSGYHLESIGCGPKRTGYALNDNVELLAA